MKFITQKIKKMKMEFIALVIMDQHLERVLIFVFQINVEVIQIHMIILLMNIPIIQKEEKMFLNLKKNLKLLIMKYIN